MTAAALDTNVVVRYLVNDDPKQGERARKLFEEERVIWIPKTVVLETEWVLRGVYRFMPREIARALTALFGLSTVEVEEPKAVAQAFEAMTAGLDFADALHLASLPSGAMFVTFDRELAKRSKPGSSVAVELLS